MENLETRSKKKRNRLDDIQKLVAGRGLMSLVSPKDVAYPWRANILCEQRRNELLAAGLARRLPVSSWFPNMAPYFGSTRQLPNAERVDQQIFNIGLDFENASTLQELEKLLDEAFVKI